ncbi:SDR family NAD(P)-dependent oxidoreductase [Achromobacter xylosoxidans]
MTDLRGRVALVTGGGAGLGRAHALLLARHGAKVVVNDLGEGADRVAAEIQAAGGKALALHGSVTDEAQVAAMVAAAMDRFGGVHILVNNAGILRDASFGKMSLDDFRLVLEVHLMGAVICCKSVWNIMREQRYGRLVMTTSSSGLYGNFGQANYSAAKMGLVGLMQTLAIEGAKYGIKVNCLAPTATTAMTDTLFPEPIKAMLVPERVSPGLIHLVSDNAPTRAVLCAGAGHFASAHITLTRGVFIGAGDKAADRVARQWSAIVERTGEAVPAAGSVQLDLELASAQQDEQALD